MRGLAMTNTNTASLREKKSWEKALWSSNIVSTVHATYITYMAITAAISSGVYTNDSFYHGTPESTECCFIFLGYISYDLVLIATYAKEWPGTVAFMFHHGASILSYGHLLYVGYAHHMALAAITMEATTPFMNFRWFLDVSGARKTYPTLYMVNGLFSTVLWFLFRIIEPTATIYLFLYRQFGQLLALGPIATVVLTTCSAVGYFLQIFWFYKIVKGALKVLSATPKQSKQE